MKCSDDNDDKSCPTWEGIDKVHFEYSSESKVEFLQLSFAYLMIFLELQVLQSRSIPDSGPI